MTNHEAIQFLNNMIGEEHGRSIGKEWFYRELCAYHVDALRMAIKALEQEPCDDAISRQAALEKIHWLGLDNDTAIKCDLAIRALSPVNTQEPKTGRWKQISPARIYECDICGQNVMTDDIRAYRYCHGCGAKMIEPQESEVEE